MKLATDEAKTLEEFEATGIKRINFGIQIIPESDNSSGKHQPNVFVKVWIEIVRKYEPSKFVN